MTPRKDWMKQASDRQLAEYGIFPGRPVVHYHSPRTARRRTAETRATAKVSRVNEGERPETLDALALRLRLRAKETGIEIEADDVRAFIGEVKARCGWTADVDEAIEYLEGHADIYKAVAAYCEDAEGYEPETRIYY